MKYIVEFKEIYNYYIEVDADTKEIALQEAELLFEENKHTYHNDTELEIDVYL